MITISRYHRVWQHFNRALDVLFHPREVFGYLLATQDLGPAWVSLATTTGLFTLSSLISHLRHVPFTATPLWPTPNYRLYQAIAMPVILGIGWWLCSYIIYLLQFILRIRVPFPQLLAVSALVLFVPLWVMMWPTEMAIALGVLDPAAQGFPGYWAAHLMPRLTTLYTFGFLWFALWSTLRILLREAFALAVLSLLATLGFWALILR